MKLQLLLPFQATLVDSLQSQSALRMSRLAQDDLGNDQTSATKVELLLGHSCYSDLRNDDYCPDDNAVLSMMDRHMTLLAILLANQVVQDFNTSSLRTSNHLTYAAHRNIQHLLHCTYSRPKNRQNLIQEFLGPILQKNLEASFAINSIRLTATSFLRPLIQILKDHFDFGLSHDL